MVPAGKTLGFTSFYTDWGLEWKFACFCRLSEIRWLSPGFSTLAWLAFWAGWFFVALGTVLCMAGCLFSKSPGLNPLCATSPQQKYDNQKCPQTLPYVPLWSKLSIVENYGLSLTKYAPFHWAVVALPFHFKGTGTRGGGRFSSCFWSQITWVQVQVCRASAT